MASVAALILSVSPPAYAGGPYMWANGNSIGKRLTVCAQDLGVRGSPGSGAFAYLHHPQTFTVENAGQYEFGGEWVYGFAWGDVNRRGWVQNGWFCNN
ncbi:hypothetical protein QF035_010787 [Streptomyces umbrinus]|jgi:hypothetical protein|uniref:SH3 domain-containing protein n=1 Tax=Streptomyces umbrinus TaxID=67370 RepID=A0ABU0TBL5_9ACTN|nr:hypothetical protein [Streptomyces umbrinus]MDQ1033205.1 hypothetical protein [Streptomyces umbrinus]